MGSNFAFLQDKFPDLADLGHKGEQYLYQDPNACFFKLRALGERIVHLMFQFDRLQDPTDHTQAKRIAYLAMEEYLPDNVKNSLNAIRILGNKAVHDNYSRPDKAALCLEIAYGVCEWFMETYGDYRYTHHPFVLPAPAAEPPAPLPAAEKSAPTPEEKKLAQLSSRKAQTAPKVEKAKRIQQNQSAASKRTISEAETRFLIDQQLRQVGWEADSQNLTFARGARPKKTRNQAIAEWPTSAPDPKTGKNHRADYALFAGTKLVGIIEAKRLYNRVNTVLDDQCREYAAHIRPSDQKYCVGQWGEYRVPFLFAANGRPYLKQLEVESGIWFRDARRAENMPRPLLGWMSPEALLQELERDKDRENQKLENLGDALLFDPRGLNLRPYQAEAVKAAEKAVRDGKQKILLAMATGTGKTRVILALLYRFLKSGRFRRILYLVDRNALGQQAWDQFTSVKLEQGNSLDQIYDINPLEKTELAPSVKVQIATVQSMIRRLFGAGDGETIPSVSAFDLVIVDEAHRGYVLDREMGENELLYRDQKDYQSKYRQVLDYFDGVKIGLTATPALQTTEIFGAPVYQYSYRQAVIDGYLIDYDAPIQIETRQSRDGIHFAAGQKVKIFRPDAPEQIDTTTLTEDVDYDVDNFNRQVITEGFNRAVLGAIAPKIDPASPRLLGKTLLFAATDRHADMAVQLLKELYAQKDVPSDAICKITGTSFGGDRKKIQDAIKRFKNEEFPSFVVTVDLLSTGVDVPAITTLVFLRRVRSRILFEQMLGRATRLCPEIHKDKFTIYDCVGIFTHMENVTNMKPVAVNPGAAFSDLLTGLEKMQTDSQIKEQAEQILVKLQRKWPHLQKEAKDRFAREFQVKDNKEAVQKLRQMPPQKAKQFLLDKKDVLRALDRTDYEIVVPRPLYISEDPDEVTSQTRGYGMGGKTGQTAERPADYLESFKTFIQNSRNDIAALEILCTRPRELKRDQLKSLLLKLQENGFTVVQLNTALQQVENREIAADIITLVRRAALGSPLVSHRDRVHRAVEKLRENHAFTPQENGWLTCIEAYLQKEDVLTPETLDEDARLRNLGGQRKANKDFNNHLLQIISELNGYLYDDTQGGNLA